MASHVRLSPCTAGVDEVGRGPLAGPVVACACVIEQDACIAGIRDSKELSAARRNELYKQLTLHTGVSWAVYANAPALLPCALILLYWDVAHTLKVSLGYSAVVDVDVIDKINILKATLLAMERAVLSLKVAPAFALVDGNRLPKVLATVSPASV